MEILESMEVRWFFRDQPDPARISRWFGAAPSEGERTDWYLLRKRPDLGFKARLKTGDPAKAETKVLLGSLGVSELAKGVEGVVERWQKLSLTVTDPDLRKHGDWLAVKKDRLLKKYAWRAGRAVPANSGEHLEAGAGFELTRLSGDARVQGYTIGIEAFGPTQRLLTILQGVATACFDGVEGLVLPAAASMSYPEWLARLAAASS